MEDNAASMHTPASLVQRQVRGIPAHPELGVCRLQTFGSLHCRDLTGTSASKPYSTRRCNHSAWPCKTCSPSMWTHLQVDFKVDFVLLEAQKAGRYIYTYLITPSYFLCPLRASSLYPIQPMFPNISYKQKINPSLLCGLTSVSSPPGTETVLFLNLLKGKTN